MICQVANLQIGRKDIQKDSTLTARRETLAPREYTQQVTDSFHIRGGTTAVMVPIVSHPASASYSESGYSNRMGWGSRPALMLIDVCRAYWTESSPLSILSHPALAAAPDAMRRLLSAARTGNVPVIWTRVEYSRPDMADAGLFWRKAKMIDVWQKGDARGLNAYLEGLEPADQDVVIVKRYPSAFFGTTMSSELQVCRVPAGPWFRGLT